MSRGSPMDRQRRRLYWPFLTPALGFYLLLFALPALYGVYVSFLSWRGQGDPQRWIGTGNYVRLWHDDIFRQAFTNTLIILVAGGVCVFACTFVLTTLLRELKHRRTFQAVLFFPYMLSPIAVGIGLALVLAPSGPLNTVLRGAGLGQLAQPWLTPDMLFRTVLAGIIWVSTGFYVILLMAGIGRIPKYFYEQADLDGANTLQKFRAVTLPLTWDVVTVAAVLWTINAVKVFEFVYGFVGVSDNPPPQARTITIQQFLTTAGGTAPQYDLGLGSAMAVVMVALIVMFIVVLRRVMRREALEF